MVDFQSRDTRRGPTVDDESESAAESATPDETDTAETDDVTEDTASNTDGDTPVGQEPLAEDDGSGPDPAEANPLAEHDSRADDDPADADPLAEAVDSPTGTPDADPLAADDVEAAEPTDSDVGVATASQPVTPSRTIDVAVVTVAGDRAELEDRVTAAFEGAGHEVVRRERLRGGYDGIQQMVDALVERPAVDVVVTVGGVGLAGDAMAIEAVHPLLEKALPGFGEAFRSRLADHIGTGIVGVRSTAGVSDGTLVFCLPGDAEAAELAVEEILATEAPLLVAQLDE